MSVGLQCKDANGNITLDTTERGGIIQYGGTITVTPSQVLDSNNKLLITLPPPNSSLGYDDNYPCWFYISNTQGGFLLPSVYWGDSSSNLNGYHGLRISFNAKYDAHNWADVRADGATITITWGYGG